MGKSRRKRGRGGLSERELRRYGIFLIVPLLILILAAALMVFSPEKRGQKPLSSEPGSGGQAAGTVPVPEMVIEPDTKEYHYNFGGSILEKNAHHEINQMMEDYFRSVSQCDMETFLHLFTSRDTSQEEEFYAAFEKQKSYIEGYENIVCYTAEGLTEDSYVVYVSYEIKFVGVDTPGPALVCVYAEKCGDGQWRIFDEEETPELTAYLEAVSQNEDVRLLIKQVDDAEEAAMEQDENLKNRILFMENGPEYMKEETGQPGEEAEGQ